MRRSTIAFAALSALMLASCGDGSPVAKGANNMVALPDGANAAAEPAPPAPDGSPPANSDARVEAPEPGASEIRIPALFHGRWGLTPADCTARNGDAKGLLLISAGEIRFFESRAVPTGDTNGSPNSFSATYTFSGEGQTWTSFQTLQLQDKRLVRTTSSPMASYTYAKCS